jgi:diguanylate cyclase (GGDEF)-like protein/PAS domain S-box-containing protein
MKPRDKTRAASVSSTTDASDRRAASSAKLTGDEILYRTLIDSLTDYAMFAVAPSGDVVSWNAGAQHTFGYMRSEIIGQSFSIIFTADDIKAGAPELELQSALSGEQTQHDRWHVRKDKTRFWGTNTVHPFYDKAGALLGFTKLVRDTTSSHEALEELSDSEQQLRLLVESVRDYALFSTDMNGNIKSWNAGAQKIFGHSPLEAVGQNLSLLYSAEDVASGIPVLELRKATTNGFIDAERWLVRKDGSRFLAAGKLSQLKRDAAGDLRGFVKIAHDVTGYHAATQDLNRRAQYDELTGLANRRTFYENVSRAIAAMKRRPSVLFAVLFIDLDYFKRINDDFGHIIADQLLDTIARRLETCVRAADMVARLGGDEFAILLNGIEDVTEATEAAERISVDIAQPATIDEREVRATVSVGIALGDVVYDLPEDILRDADTAMYTAKSEGRARAAVFDRSMKSGQRRSFDLNAELRGAVERNELRVFYQPVIRLRDRATVGFEALARWQHPKRGLLHPNQFIPKAEETDLIASIDRWVLFRASQQLVAWQADGADANLQMSVNISSKTFLYGDFMTDLRASLASSGMAAQSLRLEITESAVLERSQRASSLLTGIRQSGVALDIDDFGTGFSSLDALQHMSVDALKIDQTFIANLGSANGAALIDTIVDLAHNLSIIAVAEGIETDAQLHTLIEAGCDLGQGYLFSTPLDTATATDFLMPGAAAHRAFSSGRAPD